MTLEKEYRILTKIEWGTSKLNRKGYVSVNIVVSQNTQFVFVRSNIQSRGEDRF
jgi:hypothetical protein